MLVAMDISSGTPAGAPLRQLTTGLAIAYPIVAHLAIAHTSSPLTIAAIAMLALVVLLRPLARGRLFAWLALPGLVLGGWWLSRAAIPALALYVPPVLLPAFMAWAFGRTLLPGRTPLIAQFIQLLHTPQEKPDEAVWPYARWLTGAWTALFLILASMNLLLAALADPNGLLLACGLSPPITISQQWWSRFANLIAYLIVAAFFLIEYAYRRWRFPRQPYRNMFDFFRRLFAMMPRLLSRTP